MIRHIINNHLPDGLKYGTIYVFTDLYAPKQLLDDYVLAMQHACQQAHAFEHLVLQEIRAYLIYHHSRKQLSYWRTSTGLEVDCVIGDAEIAIEFKSSTEVRTSQLKGLHAFVQEHPQAKAYVVSQEVFPRLVKDVEIWLVRDFLEKLWNNEIIQA